MTKYSKIILIILRFSMGWVMLYAGLTKILDPQWTAMGYLDNAKTFHDFFAWFAQPAVIPYTDFMNEWALTLLGVSLLMGIFVRLSTILGAMLMMLYYFPVLEFPVIGSHSYLIDDHIIYALVLLVIGSVHAGRDGGLDEYLTVSKFFKGHPRLRDWMT